MTTSGWGGGSWGGSGWGSPITAILQLVSAIAVAENAVQLTFNQAIYWSGLLDPTDASQPALWTFLPLAGGPAGQDGTAPRPVSAAAVSQVGDAAVIVTLDRPLTPSPGTYYAVASPLIQSADQSQSLNPAYAQALFTSVFKVLVPSSTQTPTGVATRDIAAPIGAQSVQSSRAPYPQNLLQLGVPVVDDTGDYATDVGLVGLKKRVIRRILFTPGSTLFMTGFGAGAGTYAKRLASAANRSALAAACESQIAQDPEVASVSVQALFGSAPGLFTLAVLVRSRVGQAFKLLVPVST
jgi:hypothetical protein